jgi:glycine dehydrogenase subunit 1
VRDVDRALRAQGIFAGVDVSAHAGLGEALLVCVTEVHTQADIDELAAALEEAVR